MFSGEQIATLLDSLGVTHVVTLPDSTIGKWDEAILRNARLQLVRVCREGEAWAIAAGLYVGGARPIVLIQCTGLFESGDALRNILHDLQVPIFSIIGYRSYLSQEALPGDTCLVFTEPILNAWRIPYKLISQPSQLEEIRTAYEQSVAKGLPGAVLIAEGKG